MLQKKFHNWLLALLILLGMNHSVKKICYVFLIFSPFPLRRSDKPVNPGPDPGNVFLVVKEFKTGFNIVPAEEIETDLLCFVLEPDLRIFIQRKRRLYGADAE